MFSQDARNGGRLEQKSKKEEHRSRTSTPTPSSVIVSPEKKERKKGKINNQQLDAHNRTNKPTDAWNFGHHSSLSFSSTVTFPSAHGRFRSGDLRPTRHPSQ